MLENNFLNMSDGIGPLLPAVLDPAMSSCTSLNSLVSLASISTNEDGESHRPTKERGGGLVDRRKKTNNESRHRVMGSYKDAGPLRRKASTAPTAWPRDPATGKSNRDSLEMSLDAWNMDATKKTLMERAPQRKRESHIHHYTVTVPHNPTAINTSMLDSPNDRRDGDPMPFVLPPGNQSHVTPTKHNPQSFFTAMFSNGSTSSHPPRTPGPRTPSSTSPARPSTVRRLARTLLEWNLGPQTDLSRWQRESPRTPSNSNNPVTPRTPHRSRRERDDEDDVMQTPD